MRLAVIVGDGLLPKLVLDATKARAVTLHGVSQQAVQYSDIEARFEQLGGLFSSLRAAQVTDVCFAGAMGRPALDPGLFDAETLALLPRLMPLLGQGDDALLRGVIAVFEEAGFVVCAPHEVVPDLLAEVGVLTQTQPTAQDIEDAARGQAVLEALSPLDVGQGCVTCAGQVLGIEALYGTDALLTGVAGLRSSRQPSTGGVFIKRAKNGQDLRVDLPTIGPDTVEAVLAAGLSGMHLQAGRVQILDRDTVLTRADAAGLVIWASP